VVVTAAATGYIIIDAVGAIVAMAATPPPTGGGSSPNSGATPQGPAPLKSLHADGTLSKSSLDYWGKKSTQQIVDSLKPGKAEALRVKPDGTIMNGNTRIKVLRDRGFDVNSLPREPYP
jgi:hypothetical protein